MAIKTFKILLADDDQDDRLFFSKALKELPVTCDLTTVNDGIELMNFLNNDDSELPDVLFLDINMPQKSGTECLAEIKQNGWLKNLSIMFSTSNSPDAIKMVFNRGANVYIRKPNDFTKLKQVIYHALPISTEALFTSAPVKYILNAWV